MWPPHDKKMDNVATISPRTKHKTYLGRNLHRFFEQGDMSYLVYIMKEGRAKWNKNKLFRKEMVYKMNEESAA